MKNKQKKKLYKNTKYIYMYIKNIYMYIKIIFFKKYIISESSFLFKTLGNNLRINVNYR